MILIVSRPLNGKQYNNDLCVLCGSNERSEWAVMKQYNKITSSYL